MSKKAKEIGSHVDKGTRDRKLIDHCRAAVTLAGTLRKSGLPDAGMQILAGVLPVQLTIIHQAFAGGNRDD